MPPGCEHGQDSKSDGLTRNPALNGFVSVFVFGRAWLAAGQAVLRCGEGAALQQCRSTVASLVAAQALGSRLQQLQPGFWSTGSVAVVNLVAPAFGTFPD